MSDHNPYIKSSTNLPELTPKAIFLGMVLSIVLAGANSYLGLFAGMTVSASIPAAVISMAVLRLFRKHNILENNAVQTAASAGESLAAGVIFTIPALVLMDYWDDFHYVETTLIAICGGILGVMFTVPLRRALIVRQKLTFPEGIATAEVLKSGDTGGSAIKYLITAATVGGLFKFAAAGMNLWHGILDLATVLGGRTYLYFGMNLSPALVSVGYIVGLNIAILVFIGGAISWWIAIPAWIAANGPLPDVSAVDMGYIIWSKQIRYIGVGAMVIGGLWALVSIRSSIVAAVSEAMKAIQATKSGRSASVPRTELDTPMNWVTTGIIGMIIPVFGIYVMEINNIPVSFLMAVVMVLGGFLFSAVASYMAGLVGSSNNPISGVTIATILTSSLLLAFLMGTDSAKGPAAAIMIGAVVCCAAAIGGDNMQDLKSGYLLGATPRKQQFMQVVGVVSGALFIAPVLSLLNTAYGFGPKTAENPQALAAPQATLMQGVSEGVFGGNLPWKMIIIGMLIAVGVILLDQYLKEKKSTFRTPVLAVAIGIYLPFELGSAIFLGGLISWLLKNKLTSSTAQAKAGKTGLLIASGLITGEALIGILLAIPVAMTGRGDIFQVLAHPVGMWPGVFALGLVVYWLYNASLSSGRR